MRNAIMLQKPIIDFHVHLFPDKGFDAIWKVFETVYGAKMPYKFYSNIENLVLWARSEAEGYAKKQIRSMKPMPLT
jgi:hypothetical protein